MIEIAIDHNRCAKDGLCALVCPAQVFVQAQRAAVPDLVEVERCISCGHCIGICPSEAISHSAFPPCSVAPIRFDRMPYPEQVLELLRTRRSIRAFRDRPLERETIETIIDGARFAPSGHNAQSTEFLVVLDSAVLSQVTAVTVEYLQFELGRLRAKLFQALVSMVDKELLDIGRKQIPSFERIVRSFEAGEDPILHRAPALLVFHARRNIALADVNAQLALQNASLMAHALGVGHYYTGWVLATCRAPMARAWRRRVPHLIGIPPENEIYGALALGYPIPVFKNWIERKPARVQWV